MKRLFRRAAVAAPFLIAVHAHAQVPPDIEAGLQSIGHVVAPPPTYKLYAPLLNGKNLTPPGVKVTRDAAYGPDPLQKLDIFQPEGSGHTMVVFVHGGNFQRGDKRVSQMPFFDNLLSFLAAHDMVGVTMNYRLAPAVSYPAEHQDVAAVVAWLKTHAAEYGGDGAKIVLWGESSGASLIAGYLAHAEFHLSGGHGVEAAVLTSGMYNAQPGPYFGNDPAQLEQRSVWNGIDKVTIPLFVSHTELDPPEFVAQAEQLRDVLCNAGYCPTYAVFDGHSHISQTLSVGTADTTVSGPVLQFIGALH
jgi:acetyl esterase/lipase